MRRLIIGVLCFLLLGTGYSLATTDSSQWEYLHARVIEVIKDQMDEENYMRYQTVIVELREPDLRDQLEVNNTINLTSIYQIVVHPGDDVIVVARKENGQLVEGRLYSYGRDKYLLYLLGLFVLVILLIGRKNGFYSIISLAITICLILFMFFPLILRSVNPVIVVTLVSILATLITLTTIGGYNKKTYAAIIGTIGGVITAGLLTFWFGALTHIQGISDDHAELLSYLPEGCKLNFRDLLYAAIIIGALGAIMDVSMSIASSMDELQKTYPRITLRELFQGGMNIGKDIMGTMSNTLILAYAGNCITMILFFIVYQKPFTQFMNSDQVAGEVLRALCGSIGLVLCIPITCMAYISLCGQNHVYTREE